MSEILDADLTPSDIAQVVGALELCYLHGEWVSDKEHHTRPYIYVAMCHDFIKIGLGHDIDGRLSSLQTGNPYKIEMLAAWSATNHYPEQIEKYLHQALAAHRVRGEWFRVEAAYLLGFVDAPQEKPASDPQMIKSQNATY